MSLTVEAHGIDGLEEHIQQEFKTDYLFIVLDVHRFSIASLVGIDFLIGGIVGISVGKAYFRCADTLYLFEEMLGAPEASSGQINLFRHGFTC